MKKIIVSFAEFQFDEIFADLFKKENFEYYSSADVPENISVDYYIVNSYNKIEELRNTSKKNNKLLQFILIGRTNKIQKYLYLNGIFVIDPFWHKTTLGKNLVLSTLNKQFTVQLSEILNKVTHKTYTHKISNIMRLGYYADLINKHAVDFNADFIRIRSFFDHALHYFSYLKQLQFSDFPCDVEYSVSNNEYFSVLLHIYAENLQEEFLIESFGEDSEKNPMTSLLKICLKNSDFFDVKYCLESKRLTLLGVWITKKNKVELIGSSLSYCFISNKQEFESGIDKYNYEFGNFLTSEEINDLDNSNVFPDIVGNFNEIEEMYTNSIFYENIDHIRSILIFTKEKFIIENIKNEKEGNDLNFTDLSTKDVKTALEKYPFKEHLQHCADKDLIFLAKLISSGEIVNFILDKLENLNHKSLNLKKVVEKIHNILDNKIALFEEDGQGHDIIPIIWDIDVVLLSNEKHLPGSEENKNFIHNVLSQFISQQFQGLNDFNKIADDPSVLIKNNFKIDDKEIILSNNFTNALIKSWKVINKKIILEFNLTSITEDSIYENFVKNYEIELNNLIFSIDNNETSKTTKNHTLDYKKFEHDLSNLFFDKSLSVEKKIELFFNNLNTFNSNSSIEEKISSLTIPLSHKKILIDAFYNPESYNISNKSHKESTEFDTNDDVIVVSGNASIKGSQYKAAIPSATQIDDDNDVIVVSGNASIKGSQYKAAIPSGKMEEEDENNVVVVSGNASIKGSQYKAAIPSGKMEEEDENNVVVVSGNASIKGNQYKSRISKDFNNKNEESVSVISSSIHDQTDNYKINKSISNKDLKQMQIENNILKQLIEQIKAEAKASTKEPPKNKEEFQAKILDSEAEKNKLQLLHTSLTKEYDELKTEISSRDNKLTMLKDKNNELNGSIELLQKEKDELNSKIMELKSSDNKEKIKEYEEQLSIVQQKFDSEKEKSIEVKKALSLEMDKTAELEQQNKNLNSKISSLADLLQKDKDVIAKLELEVAKYVEANKPPEEDPKTLDRTWTDIQKDPAALAKHNKALEETNRSMMKEVEVARAKAAENKVTFDQLNKKINELQFKLSDKEKTLTRVEEELRRIKEGPGKKDKVA